ncbi:hypothetical protein Tco_0628056 [Tanacetum coccineum]|uniref:Integrase, catalytic region, zinc finger, CCHC-type, peptidase aspartic, catalytic n=1 Tax=Tanacetum coccineum TaxID=301880 RepID=A0ABQ4WP77_9ASTR
MENYKNDSQDIRNQLDVEAEVVQIILTGIDNDIYSTVDACPNACEMWKAIKRLKQGEPINVQDLETHLFWEFGKFTSRDGETLESYYSRFYKMMNELVRNKCEVTNHQVDVQFLLQLQPEWQRFVTLVNQSQELKIVSYHKLYDILKQHQSEVNEIRDGRRSTPQQAATRNKGKAIVNSPQPTYDQKPKMVAKDDALSKEKEIDELMALMSLSFKKIYKPTNNNLITSSNNSRANQDNTPRINRGIRYDNQRVVNIDELNAEQADWRDDTDDELEDQELEAHYLYMAQIQEVTSDVANNSGPIFDAEPLQKKFQAELDRYYDVNYASKVEIDCAKAKGDLISYKMTKMHMVVPISTREPKRTVNQSVATPLKKTVDAESTNQKPRSITRNQYKHISKKCRWWYSKITPPGYKWKPKSSAMNLIEIILFIIDSRCSKHVTGNLKILRNITIKRVYYVKGLNHNLFSVGQFCDADLEVAFRKSTCYIRDLKENDFLTGSRGTDLYSITLQDTSTPNPI